MDLILYVLLLLIGGCFAGLMAGLLGIGGGIIITPIQYMLLISSGVDSSTALTVTFATGLAVICVTMINSSYCHYKNKMIITQYLKPMMIFGFIGAICGAIAAQYIDTSLLKVFFGIICIISIAFIIAVKPPSDTSHIKKGEMLFCSIFLFRRFTKRFSRTGWRSYSNTYFYCLFKISSKKYHWNNININNSHNLWRSFSLCYLRMGTNRIA